jgi:hypothetical protein
VDDRQAAIIAQLREPDLRVRPEAAFATEPLDQIQDHPPEDPKPRDPRAWSTTDKVLQGLFAAGSFYDAVDTHRFLQESPRHIERNELLGRRPSLGKLLGATAIGQGLHGYVSHKLPHGWPRTLWQLAWLATEASVIAGNKGWKPADKFWNGFMGRDKK